MTRFLLPLGGIVLAFAIGFLAGKNVDRPVSTTQKESSATEDVSAMPRETAQEEQGEFAWYPVVKVVDGDTLVVSIEGKNTAIRMIGLDTPETVDPRKTVQCFGKEASEKARQILSGSSVRIETDPSQGKLDKYGRLLAYVYVPANSKPEGLARRPMAEGILVNEYMITEGYGHEYTYNLPYKYQAEFKAAEKKAREEKKGLWADDACANESARSTKVTPAAVITAVSGNYECSKNVYNCSSFKTQAEAQAAFEACGGSSNDIHKLDSDGDSKVCESLP